MFKILIYLEILGNFKSTQKDRTSHANHLILRPCEEQKFLLCPDM